jgi:hypothetical protein
MDRHRASETTVVYTDGAALGNGRRGARAGYGVYWGPGYDWYVCMYVFACMRLGMGCNAGSRAGLAQGMQRMLCRAAM